MGNPESEFDFQRQDNPKRIYAAKHIVYSLALIVNTIGKIPNFRDINAVVVMSSPEIGIETGSYGLDIEGTNEHREILEKYITKVSIRLESFEEELKTEYGKLSEKERVKKIEERASRIALRGRRALERYQAFRENRKEK